jgi:hypothetical protein
MEPLVLDLKWARAEEMAVGDLHHSLRGQAKVKVHRRPSN